jgi:hypothetical protein
MIGLYDCPTVMLLVGTETASWFPLMTVVLAAISPLPGVPFAQLAEAVFVGALVTQNQTVVEPSRKFVPVMVICAGFAAPLVGVTLVTNGTWTPRLIVVDPELIPPSVTTTTFHVPAEDTEGEMPVIEVPEEFTVTPLTQACVGGALWHDETTRDEPLCTSQT